MEEDAITQPAFSEQIGKETKKVVNNKVGQEQIHGIIFGEQVSWQGLILDLINSEQLDPWDVDIILLTNKFLDKVRKMEEADFFVSSKVLLAASLLLRIKSEILLNVYLPSLDDTLFGREEKKSYSQERIELDEEIPELVPRTPLPRSRKVTLKELMSALGKAIHTENRRVERVVVARQREIEAALALPKRRINLKDQVSLVYGKLKEIFFNRDEKVNFNELVGSGAGKEERIETFVPLLHLDTQHRAVLEQDGHGQDIWVWLKEVYDRKNAGLLELWRREVEEAMKEEEELKGEVEEDSDEEKDN